MCMEEPKRGGRRLSLSMSREESASKEHDGVQTGGVNSRMFLLMVRDEENRDTHRARTEIFSGQGFL